MRSHRGQEPRSQNVRSKRSDSPPTGRAPDDPSLPRLQRSLGNRALQRSLLGDGAASRTQADGTARAVSASNASATLPARLTMGTPDDAYEREADGVAERVMRMPTPQDAEARPEPPVSGASAQDTLRRTMAPASARGEDAGNPNTVDAGHVADALSEPGRSLEPATRSFMEARFGQDFSEVRVHTGQRADASAQAVNATAYTLGHHLVFAEGAYRPETQGGRRLIAHELTHVGQQAAAGPRLQRDEKPAQVAPADASLDAIFDRLGTETNKPVGPKTREKLRDWAANYEKKRGAKAGYEQISGALQRFRMYGSMPEVFSDAEIEAQKFKPPVPCDQIIPFKVGSKVRITHLLDKILPPDRVGTLKSIAADKQEEADEAAKKNPAAQPASSVEEIVRKHPSAVFDLIMSANVPKSATAVITASGPEDVEAKIDLPAIPAKGDLPAYEAFTAVMSLHFDIYGGGYTLKFLRMDGDKPGASFSLYGLGFQTSGDGIQVGVKGMDYFKVKLVAGDDGALTLRAFDINPFAKLLFGLEDEIALFDVTRTGQVGQPAANAQKSEADVRSKYAPPRLADPPKLYAGAGMQWTDRSSLLLSAGWKFTFSPGLGLVKVPLAFQFDYAPRTDVFAGIYSGSEFTIPSRVPVRLSLIGGARAGSIETTTPDGGAGPRTPVAGPVFGAGVGVRLGSSVELQLDTTHMLNLIQFGTDLGPTWIPNVGLKTSIDL